MNPELVPCGVVGAFGLRLEAHHDDRGGFCKLFQASAMGEVLGPRPATTEQYVSTSNAGVVRGIHFQLPPADHEKFVYCLDGAALDVIVDLRKGSPTEGKVASIRLDPPSENGVTGVFIPRGCGHGFLSLKDQTVLLYSVSTEYAPLLDSGVLWSSIDFDWPSSDPIISDRDRSFPSRAHFDSPFVYEPS